MSLSQRRRPLPLRPAFISRALVIPRVAPASAPAICPLRMAAADADDDDSTPPARPNDPTSLRTESDIRRNQPVKPLRRRPRRRTAPDPIDWDNIPSVPVVRPSSSPESGEDYWIDVRQEEKSKQQRTAREKPQLDEDLKDRLKKEVVSPYTQNWILRVTALVVVLIVLVALFGGTDKAPIIPVPDL